MKNWSADINAHYTRGANHVYDGVTPVTPEQWSAAKREPAAHAADYEHCNRCKAYIGPLASAMYEHKAHCTVLTELTL